MYGEDIMRYIIDIPNWQDKKIKMILEDRSKGYSGVDDFVVVACENQIKLEEGMVAGVHTDAEYVPSKNTSGDIPLLSADVADCPTVEMAEAIRLNDKILWGQVYRILPIKIGVRVLANMVKVSGDAYVDAEKFRERAADAARDFGKRLKALDELHGRKPGRKLSTGLPTGKKADDSKNMYRAMYLAGVRRTDGLMTGALSDLRFVNFDGNDRMGITERGLEFAKLENPLLDGQEQGENGTISEEETEYYLSIIGEFLPQESEFMKAVLSELEKGGSSREEFDRRVKAFVESVWPDKTTTDATAHTMGYGALSRMWEMKLVDNERRGRRVFYNIEDRGLKYLYGNGGE